LGNSDRDLTRGARSNNQRSTNKRETKLARFTAINPTITGRSFHQDLKTKHASMLKLVHQQRPIAAGVVSHVAWAPRRLFVSVRGDTRDQAPRSGPESRSSPDSRSSPESRSKPKSSQPITSVYVKDEATADKVQINHCPSSSTLCLFASHPSLPCLSRFPNRMR
jgi:hypothetical protein